MKIEKHSGSDSLQTAAWKLCAIYLGTGNTSLAVDLAKDIWSPEAENDDTETASALEQFMLREQKDTVISLSRHLLNSHRLNADQCVVLATLLLETGYIGEREFLSYAASQIYEDTTHSKVKAVTEAAWDFLDAEQWDTSNFAYQDGQIIPLVKDLLQSLAFE